MRRPIGIGGTRGTPEGGLLVLWRTKSPDAIASCELDALRRLLPGLAILGDRRWPAARVGDPAAAAASAIDRIRRDGAEGIPADIVMSNLVLGALGGDATARVVLAHAVRTLARRRPDLPELPRIAWAWSRGPHAASASNLTGVRS